jgi:hypothetical protein
MVKKADGGRPLALFGSVLALLVVAVIGIAVAGPDTSSSPVAQSSATPAPQPSGTPDEEDNDGIARQNLTYVQEILGDEYVIEGEELVAHTAAGLPPELSALATVTVLPGDGQPFTCPDVQEGSCTENNLSDGTKEIVEASGAIHSAAGSNFGALTIRLERTNGEIVVVQLSVLGKPSSGSTTELEDEVHAWLKSNLDRLVAAAQDTRLAVSPA